METSNDIHDHFDSLVSEHRPLLASAWRAMRESRSGHISSECDRYAEYRSRPLDFVTEILHKRLWAAERDLVSAVFKHKRVAIRSCRKGGKTFSLAVLVETFINLWPCIVITIAPTHRQVKELLWGEINQLHREGNERLIGKCDQLQLRVGPRHYALGFSTDRPGRIHGFHAGAEPPEDPDQDLTVEEIAARLEESLTGLGDDTRLLFIFDEAAEVDQPLYDAMKGSMLGPNTYLVLAGNPVMDQAGEHEFAKAHQPGSDYHRMKITALEGYDDPLDSDAEYRVPNWLVDEEAIDRQRKDWGEDSPLFKAYVLGQFASKLSEWRVIRPELLTASQARDVCADVGVHIGIDVSRAGKDECVASRWAYGVKTAEHVWNSDDLMHSVTVIEALRVRWGEDGEPLTAENVHIDMGGLGGGVVDRLRQKGLDVDGVDFGSGAVYEWAALTGETKFVNRRAELHWIMRRALEEGIAQIPAHFTGSCREATWADYELRVRSGGTAVQIEPKEKIKKRYGRSPDHFDSDLLAWSRASVGFTYQGVY